MDLSRLIPALQRVQTSDSDPPQGSRAATYLRTYPALLTLASSDPVDDATSFLQLVTAVYGWMPRVVRLDSNHLDCAISALRRAKEATDTSQTDGHIANVAECLHSVVGASKLLHFANPGLFPIWDRNVEGWLRNKVQSPYNMAQVRNYTAYAAEVHTTRQAPGFSEFHRAFNQAFQERLRRLRIAPYPLTEVRSVESAMFELAQR